MTISAQETKVHTIDVTLETIFEDGEKAVEQRVEEVMAMEDFWAKYQAWQLVDMSQEQVKFRSQVEEVSPLVTLSGYSTIAP
ncbi:BofC N-terminal domain-containing protein [Jeotgalibacillus sp. S-D1]|uniref:BofC N-terminal domain-containing protein n=1 Tax=Jeotgalibacillus sp. S-D1 TaxID=2552189 RepID=UPI00140551CC|nr:BofC N-terminal domain-containing protein [Jeotgalibacillus sp. S-D1]